LHEGVDALFDHSRNSFNNRKSKIRENKRNVMKKGEKQAQDACFKGLLSG
jgi:hypothetical protein